MTKREDFNFPVVNFTFICSKIPTTFAYYYMKCIFQLITYKDFCDREVPLIRKLLNQKC